MHRRSFGLHATAGLAGMAALPALTACAALRTRDAPWASIERRTGGRLGVAILDAQGRLEGHRLDERFPLCSTFKWLAAAHVLHRVDRGQERLERRIRFGADALLPHSPVTSRHAGGDGMTLAQLCQATVATSDNAAANLILATYGGPAGLTAYARTLGDEVTRLDRWEPELNDTAPGDPRDSTSPRAAAKGLHAVLLGTALTPSSRARLAAWLESTETNGRRLRADLPAGWRMGSKTGGGPRGSTHDVGIFWPPGRAPVIVAVYLTDTRAPEAERNGAVAEVARYVTSA